MDLSRCWHTKLNHTRQPNSFHEKQKSEKMATTPSPLPTKATLNRIEAVEKKFSTKYHNISINYDTHRLVSRVEIKKVYVLCT